MQSFAFKNAGEFEKVWLVVNPRTRQLSLGSQDGRSRLLSEQEVRDDRLQVPCLERLDLRIAGAVGVRSTYCLDLGRLVVVAGLCQFSHQQLGHQSIRQFFLWPLGYQRLGSGPGHPVELFPRHLRGGARSYPGDFPGGGRQPEPWLRPLPLESTITTGNAQPWYNSSQIASFFGGQPSAQQVASFDNVVMQRVEQTFQQSGVPLTLTLNSTDPATHTLSLVSNTTSNTTPGVIGMTQIGGSGFSFIDQEAQSAQSLDQLEWIVAHSISHELMLALGVGENYDQTGNYIDARNANWAMMVDPNATFSQAAAQALQAQKARRGHS